MRPQRSHGPQKATKSGSQCAAAPAGLDSGYQPSASPMINPGLHIMLFTPASVAIIIGVVMLIAFLAGTLPARRAAKQNPIHALRYE